MKNKSELIATLLFFLSLLVVALAPSQSSYILHVVILILIWSIVVSCWNLVMGYAGIVSYGQLAFFAIGGYVSGMLASKMGLSPIAGIVLGGMLAAFAGFIVAAIALRLDRVYLALVTFALHLSLSPILVAGRSFGTGGTQGILMIPPIAIGDFSMSAQDKLPWFYGAFIISALSVAIVYKVVHSPFGLAFRAMRDGPVQARSIGINAIRYKALVFTLAAFLTGIAGAYYAHYSASISPRILSLDTFLLVFGMLIIGGRGSLSGSLFGVVLVTVVNEALRSSGEIRPLVVGLMVVASVMFLPNGLADLSKFFSRRKGR